MKTAKRIISAFVAVIIMLTACLPAFAISYEKESEFRPESFSVAEYKRMLWEEGYPVFTTKQFLNFFNTISSVFNFISGKGFSPSEKLEVVVDEFIADACNQIYLNAGLDIVAVLNNVPAANSSAELITTVFQIDTDTIRKEMYNKRDQYREKDNVLMENVCFYLGLYLAIIDSCEIYAVPTDDPDLYEVKIRTIYRNGDAEIHTPNIFINRVTGECTGKNPSEGLMGLGFNFNINEMMLYATIDAWMRDFGFCVFYDIAANSMPALWSYVTRRFKFEYDGLEWMIQIWKGNYLVANGGEVGVYNRAPEKFGTYYDCVSDEYLLEMSLQIYRGDKLLVNQEPQMHWWVNGFGMSDRMYLPHSLTLKSTIVMRDEEMLKAFCNSIDNHYMHDVTYTVDGLTVNLVW